MSISQQITTHIATSVTPVSVSELYCKITTCKRHSIRARLHESASRGTITRIAKGLYIAPGQQVGAQADARTAVRELADRGAKFDFIVLDLPYCSRGTLGRNRNLADFATITPEEFGAICADVRRMLRTDDCPALFIFSTGKESSSARKRYQQAIDQHLIAANFGEYTKTYADGSPCMFGKYQLPTEGLWAYTRSGRPIQGLDLNIMAIRPNKGYPTQKPVTMMTAVLPSTGIVFDPFAGANTTAQACAQKGLSSLSLDIAHNPATLPKN